MNTLLQLLSLLIISLVIYGFVKICHLIGQIRINRNSRIMTGQNFKPLRGE